MGFFDKILKGLGFEGQNYTTVKVEKKEVKRKAGEFNLEDDKEEIIEEMKPKSQEEVAKVVDYLKKEGCVIANLSNFEDSNFYTALSFLSGAVYAFGGQVYKLDDSRYKLVV